MDTGQNMMGPNHLSVLSATKHISTCLTCNGMCAEKWNHPSVISVEAFSRQNALTPNNISVMCVELFTNIDFLFINTKRRLVIIVFNAFVRISTDKTLDIL